MDKGKWETITREELLDLYVKNDCVDSIVADIFGVTRGQVAYKRKKLGISSATISFKRFMNNQDNEFRNKINEDMKQIILSKDISEISKIITHYAFRNGPIEDMHANGQISQEEMKTLNKYMNNRIATLLYLLKEQDWLRLVLFLETHKSGAKWDEPELLLEEMDKINELYFDIIKNK